jgi:hypothetical protein
METTTHSHVPAGSQERDDKRILEITRYTEIAEFDGSGDSRYRKKNIRWFDISMYDSKRM